MYSDKALACPKCHPTREKLFDKFSKTNLRNGHETVLLLGHIIIAVLLFLMGQIAFRITYDGGPPQIYSKLVIFILFFLSGAIFFLGILILSPSPGVAKLSIAINQALIVFGFCSLSFYLVQVFNPAPYPALLNGIGSALELLCALIVFFPIIALNFFSINFLKKRT